MTNSIKKYTVTIDETTYRKFVEVAKHINQPNANLAFDYCVNRAISMINSVEAEESNKKFIEQCEDWILHPTNFANSNVVMLPPQSMTNGEVACLCAAHIQWGQHLAVMSCWKPTKDHLKEIEKTGCIWLVCMGQSMPPVCLAAKKPTDYDGIDFIPQ